MAAGNFKNRVRIRGLARLFLIVGFIIFSATFSPTAVSANERAIRVVPDLTHESDKVGRYKALLIGINDYKDPRIPDLETPVDDVTKLADLLKEKYNFAPTVILNEKATKQNLYVTLRKLVAESKPDESILIYYAGHGEIDRLYNDGWWIPSDAQAGNSMTYFDNVQVQKAMRGMKARHVLLVSDSCYSGTLFGQGRSIPKAITNRYYSELYNEKSRWGMTSGNKTPVSDSGTAGHSVFAYQFIKVLQKNISPYLSTQEIYTRIAPIISNNSEQTPMCRPIKNTGDQGGGFVFIRHKITSPAEEPGRAEKPSFLKVESNIEGAQVFINNSPKGRTNYSLNDIKPGDYRIRVTKEGFTSYEKTVSLKPGRTLRVFAYLDPRSPPGGSLYIDTHPSNADIRIQGLNTNYVQGMELKPGRYRVQVGQKGYSSKTINVDINPGEDTSIFVKLEKIVASIPKPQPLPEKPLPEKTGPGGSGTTPSMPKSDLFENNAAPADIQLIKALPELVEDRSGRTINVVLNRSSDARRRVMMNSTLESISRSKRLTFGTTLSNPPFSFIDDAGKPAGIEIILARRMAKSLGAVPVMVRVDPKDLIPNLMSNKYDIIMNGTVITQQKNLRINFSDPFHESSQAVLMKQNSGNDFSFMRDLSGTGYRIMVLSHSKGQFLLEQQLPGSSFHTTGSAFEAVNALAAGKIDLFLGNRAFCQLIVESGYSALKIIDSPFSYDPIGWGLRKGDPDFLLFLNAYAKEVKNSYQVKRLINHQIEVCNKTIENKAQYAKKY